MDLALDLAIAVLMTVALGLIGLILSAVLVPFIGWSILGVLSAIALGVIAIIIVLAIIVIWDVCLW